MNRYRIRISVDGKRKLYYIEDQENYDIVLLPSKYLKHKADANRSPNTVRRLALSICYYLNYLDQTGTEQLQVAKRALRNRAATSGSSSIGWWRDGISQTIEQRRREMEPATHTSRMCSCSFYIWRITDIRNPCGCWLTTRSPYPMR